MQTSPLEKIVNYKVKSFAEDNNKSLRFLFDNGSKISIYNKYEISPSKISKIVGSKLIAYEDNNESVILSFDSIKISIDLRDNAWSGPEAIELILANNEIIVWN